MLKPDDIALDEVVVSANRSQTLRRESPVVVNVLDTKLLESTHSTTLVQGLNFHQACEPKIIAPIADSRRYASMGLMVIIRKY